MSIKLLSRKEFLVVLPKLQTRKWEGVVLHHTSNPDYEAWKKKPDEKYWWEAIDKFHREKRGWKMIGYHWLIFPSGLIAMGRPMNMIGAHTKGQNSKMVGVCLLGNFNKDEVTNDQYISCWFVLTALLVHLGLSERNLWFHRDFNATDCPGSKWDREQLRRKIAAHINEMKKWLGSE